MSLGEKFWFIIQIAFWGTLVALPFITLVAAALNYGFGPPEPIDYPWG